MSLFDSSLPEHRATEPHNDWTTTTGSPHQKFRNIARNDKVAFVVDDITSRDPWRVRCLEIRGNAEQAEIPPSHGAAGDELDTSIIRLTPRRIISFGIDDQVSEPHQLQVDRRDA